jgi:hypothetical protein
MTRLTFLPRTQCANDQALYEVSKALVVDAEQVRCGNLEQFRAALANGHMMLTLRFAFHCLHRRPRRRSWSDVLSAALNYNNDAWFKAFVRDAFAFHRQLRHMRHIKHEDDDVAEEIGGYVSRRLKRVLRNRRLHANAQSEGLSAFCRAVQRTREIWSSLQHAQHIIWFDNFFKPRIMSNPATAYASFNSTCIAVLATEGVSRSVYCHPSLLRALRQVQHAVNDVLLSFVAMKNLVRITADHHMQRCDLRVPLDIRRPPSSSVLWTPFMLTRCSVGDQVGLLRIVQLCVHIANHAGTPYTPILMDENLHYRLLRLRWSEHTNQYDVHTFMNRVPILFGVWHAYKYAAVQTFRAFHPIIAILMRGDVAVGESFPVAPKLRTIELMFAAILLLPQEVKRAVHHSRLQRESALNRVEQRLRTCETCTSYTPAISREFL